MRITKSKSLNVGYVKLKNGKIIETLEIRPGILLDLDKNGEIIGIEVLSLSELAPALRISPKTKKRRSFASRSLA